ncbi:hypothetical protein NDU88_003432 [Pleurodeles waltl]|uniref:Uncharacterized protein n=1 Tax=Pleurodeles waltl TaxID=8319 RepID=A0AAV7M4B0_PLEWA|nr:hypothetical protein NDU88_003432 [Pleurodeles waltl]
MGKRKAVDPPALLDGKKKLKKRPRKLIDKAAHGGPKSLGDIDLLFEEVEAILNSELGTCATLPQSKSSFNSKKIQEFFKKKKKSQIFISGASNDGTGEMPIVNATIPSIQQGMAAYSSNSNPSCIQEASLAEGIERIPPPLSPEIRIVPNVPCRNRFEFLTEEGDLTESHDLPPTKIDIEAAISPPSSAMFSEPSSSKVTLPLIFHRVEEDRNLVLQLTKLLQGKMLQQPRCKCLKLEIVEEGGIVAPELV